MNWEIMIPLPLFRPEPVFSSTTNEQENLKLIKELSCKRQKAYRI
jgi:hypothetical protein